MASIPYDGRPLRPSTIPSTPLKVVQSPYGPLRHLARRADDQRSLITICGCNVTDWQVLDLPASMIQQGGDACARCLRGTGSSDR